MNKTLIAFAAFSAIAGAAQAQSTVTLYGLLDANFGSYRTNQVVPTVVGGAPISVQSLTQKKIDAGGLNGSRWGIRVKEDIGGGFAAIGNLESGLNIDTGASAQGGLLFGRRANVGLTGGFGTVTVGRNTSSYDDVSADHAMMAQDVFDPSNTNNGPSTMVAATLGTLAGNVAFLNRGGTGTGAQVTWVGYNSRINNSVKYISPNFGGFIGSLMYALGEDKSPTVTASRTVSASLKFANGPLLVSGGYQSEQSSTTAVGVANPNTATGAKPALENTLLNVVYDLGIAKIGAGFNRAKYKAVTAAGGDLPGQREYSLSVAVPVGATTIGAGYAQSKGDFLGKSTGFGLQALYSLSKRTTLYAGGVSTKNYDKVIASTMLLAPTSNIGRSTTYAVGVRHTF